MRRRKTLVFENKQVSNILNFVIISDKSLTTIQLSKMVSSSIGKVGLNPKEFSHRSYRSVSRLQQPPLRNCIKHCCTIRGAMSRAMIGREWAFSVVNFLIKIHEVRTPNYQKKPLSSLSMYDKPYCFQPVISWIIYFRQLNNRQGTQ